MLKIFFDFFHHSVSICILMFIMYFREVWLENTSNHNY
jgi:hypothetical protein